MAGRTRGRGLRRTVLAALASAVALLAAPTTLLAPDAGAQQRRVVVVGDSVILGAQAPMTAAFAQRGWAVTFDAAVSRSTSGGLQTIESHRSELTDSLVVSLGANDAGSPSAFRQRVQAILDATAGVPHVYWVTLREVRDYYAPANQIVRDLVAGRPNVTVVDWHGATAGATELTAGDGLHLNGAGAARMTQLVTDAVISGSVAPPAPAPAPPAPDAEVPTAVPEPPPTSAAQITSAPPAPPSSTDGAGSGSPAAEEALDPGARDERAAAAVGVGPGGGTGGRGVTAVVLLLVAGGLAAAAAWWSIDRRGRTVRQRSGAHPTAARVTDDAHQS